MIKDHVAASVRFEPDDLDNVPFEQKGGRFKAWQLFGEGLNGLIEKLNEVLVA
jgi:type I restriction enzyme R subunit